LITSIETTIKDYITNNPELNKARHIATVNKSGERNGTDSTRSHDKNQNPPIPFSKLIKQSEAIVSLRDFSITPSALRKYALCHNQAELTKDGVMYSSDFITDLKSNYFTKQETMKFLGIKKSGFYYWVQRHDVATIVIGKVSLIPKGIVLGKNRDA